MAYWLFKEEPTHYNYADLERDGRAVWEGVANPLALKNLRSVKPGDRVFYYHTGKEKAVVAEMTVAADSTPEAVVVEPTGRLTQPVTLKEIKADPSLRDWDLVRISRLSVVPVTAQQWKRVHVLARGRG
jgi:predicted RNA-binding protein with PUA-like domain